MALLAAAPQSQAAQNLLQDGGFEQFLDQPDERGNPFKAWSGWKWEGNCRRVADTAIKHAGQASAEILSYGPCKLLLYLYLFGSGKIWFDDLRLEKIQGPAPRPGLTLGEAEETFHGFTGPGGLTCPSCGLQADPAAAKCAICGEPLSGVADYALARQTYAKAAGLLGQAKAQGVDVLYWVYTCMAPGADRFNYKEMPIWPAFNQYPDTHRVWDGGWCGHIIADKWSGGVSGANCVICLESPHTRDLFRAWLKERFGSIAQLNAAWGTRLGDFAEVQLPDYRRREPNDAKRYDWLDFNLWRFTDFMKWAKAQQRQLDPDIPMATCAPHYNFTREWGESGSDVEALLREVNDFCLNESPPSTKFVDFLRSLSDNRKAIVEVEGSEYRNTMASFLHGLSALSLYWGWMDKPGDGGALLYGRDTRPPYCSLPEAERFLRTGLDLRRLRQEILAFQQDQHAPVALLYSRASMLQVPEVSGDKTPYLLELDRTYDALLELGVPVDFISTRQVLEGKLAQYRALVVPAATYEQAEVVRKTLDFARNGGQVVLVPNSWFFDQYNRRQDYLAQLGIQVTSMKAPKAIPLVPASMAELMNAVLAAGGVSHPVRFLTPDGVHVPGLEYRAIKTADGWLAYVNNLDRQNDKQLKLASGPKLSGVRNLTLETDLPLSFTLPAGETYILRLIAFVHPGQAADLPKNLPPHPRLCSARRTCRALRRVPPGPANGTPIR